MDISRLETTKRIDEHGRIQVRPVVLAPALYALVAIVAITASWAHGTLSMISWLNVMMVWPLWTLLGLWISYTRREFYPNPPPAVRETEEWLRIRHKFRIFALFIVLLFVWLSRIDPPDLRFERRLRAQFGQLNCGKVAHRQSQSSQVTQQSSYRSDLSVGRSSPHVIPAQAGIQARDV